MRPPLVFIVTAEETFTPCRSGALATHTHACCREANAAGVETIVFARPSYEADPYDDVESVLYEAPAPPTGGAALLIRRAERRVRHWTRLLYGAYVDRTVRAIEQNKLTQATLIVHNDPELIVALRKRLPKAILIHWFHNQHACKPRPRATFAACVNHSIAVSDFIRGWTQQAYGLRGNAIDRIYNGVDLDLFRPRNEQTINDRPIVNFTGRTGIEKAPDLVLSAALNLVRQGTVRPFAVQIIGSNHWGERTMDDYQARLDHLAATLEREGVHVEMPGHLSRRDTADRMRMADIHIVPSRWDEPFGLTTLEGMACGMATIGSRTGATPEILRDDAGLLFENESASGLADHMRTLIDDAAARRDLAHRGRQRAECFSWATTWHGLRSVLEKVA
jgi:glycosyltransferase involved in cell wall biosynthesis